MAVYKKHFTVQEARAQIPILRKRLIRIHDLLAEARADQTHEGVVVTAILRGNGKGPILTGVGSRKDEAQKMIEAIAEQGIQIKDLQTGLVDFPHFLNGDPEHEVLLCWRLDEDTIEYWHEIDGGFAGRTPL
ncbi:MAG: hypothetical protein JWQ02_2588 [Capsulimonas sp.]|jgi:hypothetical protein|nr:hypothetical protein [Capsulimonas sp.]